MVDGARSTEATRSAMTGDVTLEADDAAVLQYEATSSRWRALAAPHVETMPSAPTVQTFTSSGTWTRPAGCRAALVDGVGSGGGGGGSDSANRTGEIGRASGRERVCKYV